MKVAAPILIFCCMAFSCSSQQGEPDHRFEVNSTSECFIYIDSDADELIQWAAGDLADGMGKILGSEVRVEFTDQYSGEQNGIYIVETGDPLTENLPADISDTLQEQWETYVIKQVADNLLIAGSDTRGTVYGISEFAERIGLSPWTWWADVRPIERGSILLDLPSEGIIEGPSVRYRGIFLNDEDWGLQPWAANTFEPETGDIGPRTYEKIFQLLLKLKANTIWPAMHPCSKAFFTIPGNKEMAEKYHICIGTSHAEPMLRNNVDEWDEEKFGEFNYFINPEQVKAYWQERIDEVNQGCQIITMGMRGIHDSGMEGDASVEEKVQMLETIISDQREILGESKGKPVGEIPQVFIPYKEVLELYDAGLKLPEDITLMWTDDNYGYIRRLSNEAERQRSGGSGIYYHISYWGRPHDYLWLSTTQPGLIWYEMSRAYQNGAQRIWICNVGDIKPAEYDMEFFLDLAWDIHSISENSINDHLVNWSIREFGEDRGEEIAGIMQEYYRLAFLRRPEFMGWSTTEPTTTTTITAFTLANNNELQRRIDDYTALAENVRQIAPDIPGERRDAYFELVSYPVRCAALMNQKFLYAQQALMANDPEEQMRLEGLSLAAYERIVELTSKYNHETASGKWNRMMSMHPRDLPVFDLPEHRMPDSLEKADQTGSSGDQQMTPIFLQASDYSGQYHPEGFEWKCIDGLGYSDSAITLFPLKIHFFSAEAPSLEYRFSIEKPGKYQIEVRCLPTHTNNFDHRIWLEVNGLRSERFSINTVGRSEAWKQNVLRNYQSVTLPVTIDHSGIQSLKIFVNQTGIVLDQIAVNPEGAADYYEIIK